MAIDDYTFNVGPSEDEVAQAGQRAFQSNRVANTPLEFNQNQQNFLNAWQGQDIESTPEAMRKSLYKQKQRQYQRIAETGQEAGTGLIAEAKETASRGKDIFDASLLYKRAGDMFQDAQTPEEKAEAQNALNMIGEVLGAYEKDQANDPIEGCIRRGKLSPPYGFRYRTSTMGRRIGGLRHWSCWNSSP